MYSIYFEYLEKFWEELANQHKSIRIQLLTNHICWTENISNKLFVDVSFTI